VADAEGKEWAIDRMISAVQAIKDKKMGFLKDIPVGVLHFISSQI
jgi:hypothetical protein